MILRKPQPVGAEFPCAECGKTAARVTLLPPGAIDGSPFSSDAPPGFETIGSESFRVSITGGPVPGNQGPVAKTSIPTIQKALTGRDPGLLASINTEYANFYCRKCGACYCKDHWKTEVYYDESFYDCTYGTCPKDHRTKLDD